MTLQLHREHLKKLTHSASEIRLRALNDISAKFQRALEHNETIHFKAGELCKQLVRWFGIRPIMDAKGALCLLFAVLDSRYGKDAIEHLSLERLKQEIQKIKLLLKDQMPELEIIDKIMKLLYRDQLKNESDEVAEIVDLVSMQGSLNDEQNDIEIDYIDCETAWSKPTIRDFTTLKTIADVLADKKSHISDVEDALQSLQLLFSDYPAEFFLQAPNIYLKLLNLYEIADEVADDVGDDCAFPFDLIVMTVIKYLKHLKSSLELRQKCATYKLQENNGVYLTKTQLKVETALQLVLKQTLKYLYTTTAVAIKPNFVWTFELLLEIIGIYRQQNLCFEFETLKQMHSILNQINETEPMNRSSVLRIQYLALSYALQDMTIYYSELQPFEQIELLEPQLKDYSFKICYNARYKRLLEFINDVRPDCAQKYTLLSDMEIAIKNSVKIIKQQEPMSNTTKINCMWQNCWLINKLSSKTLINSLLETIHAILPTFINDKLFKKKVEIIIQNLLQLDNDELRKFVCNKITMEVKEHFASLIDANDCNIYQHINKDLFENGIFGYPLNLSIIRKIIDIASTQRCDECSLEMKTNCETILHLILFAHKIPNIDWIKFNNEVKIQQCMHLILCVTDSKKITEELLIYFEPYKYNDVHLLHLLQGNLAFLFHPLENVRAQALEHMLYILDVNEVIKSEDYLPKIQEMKDLISHNIIYIERPIQIKTLFVPTEKYMEESEILELMAILNAPETPPIVRKNILMDLNIKCQSWEFTQNFCEICTVYPILKLLGTVLLKDNDKDYTDSDIPAIGILCKCICANLETRFLLSNKQYIYMLLFRSIIMFQHNIQLRNDVALSIYVLIFHNYIVFDSYKPPDVNYIISNLKTPIESVYNETTMILKNDEDEKVVKWSNYYQSDQSNINSFLRHCIAKEFNESIEINYNYLVKQNDYDIDNDLKLTIGDAQIILGAQPKIYFKSLFIQIEDEEDQQELVKLVCLMDLSLNVYKFPDAQKPQELDGDFYRLTMKYLEKMPTSYLDEFLYDKLLQFLNNCVRLKLDGIIMSLMMAIDQNFNHILLLQLKNYNLRLTRYYRLYELQASLLQVNEKYDICLKEPQRFYTNLFDFYYEILVKTFRARNLQCFRCILSLLHMVSANKIYFTDNTANAYCNQFIELSLEMKCLLFTGATIHKICLKIIIQLYKQMEEPRKTFKLTDERIKYISLLGAHVDDEVRALAWCLLGYCARYIGDIENDDNNNVQNDAQKKTKNNAKNVPKTNAENAAKNNAQKYAKNRNKNVAKVVEQNVAKNVQLNGNGNGNGNANANANVNGHVLHVVKPLVKNKKVDFVGMTKKLDYLPGGFMACCLCTLLNANETLVTRVLAGNLFIELITENPDLNAVSKCLKYNNFYREFQESISIVTPDEYFELNSKLKQLKFVNCDIINCYCQICILLIRRDEKFILDFTERIFMHKLYDLIKCSVKFYTLDYCEMATNVCQLYGICYSKNFPFLQRTVCRDELFIKNFYKLLQNLPITNRYSLIYVINLMFGLCEDTNSYELLCAEMAKNSLAVVSLIRWGLEMKSLQTLFQNAVLQLLTILLEKTDEYKREYDSQMIKDKEHEFFNTEVKIEFKAFRKEELETEKQKVTKTGATENAGNSKSKGNKIKKKTKLMNEKQKTDTQIELPMEMPIIKTQKNFEIKHFSMIIERSLLYLNYKTATETTAATVATASPTKETIATKTRRATAAANTDSDGGASKATTSTYTCSSSDSTDNENDIGDNCPNKENKLNNLNQHLLMHNLETELFNNFIENHKRNNNEMLLMQKSKNNDVNSNSSPTISNNNINADLTTAPKTFNEQLLLNKCLSTEEIYKNIPITCNLSNDFATIIFIDLYRILMCDYTPTFCKFDTPPNHHYQSIIGALSILLKVSTAAQLAAEQLKLLPAIVKFFNIFLDEIQMPVVTYVRRYGERRIASYLKNFSLLFHLLTCWYSSTTSFINNRAHAHELTKILIQLTSWSHYFDADLKLLFYQLLAFLTERSFVVCLEFSLDILANSHSILKSIMQTIVQQTTQAKITNKTFDVNAIKFQMRTVMNCCATIEGRRLVVKEQLMNTFDTLLPFNLKNPKIKIIVFKFWLQFWELFSRYEEGVQIRNLNQLCNLIQNSKPLVECRLYALQILKNFCTLTSNRNTLISATEFLNVIESIVKQELYNEKFSMQEQYVICLSLWRLISYGAKYIVMIRGTRLAKSLAELHDKLKALNIINDNEQKTILEEFSYGPELLNILDVIFYILENQNLDLKN